MIEKYLSNLGYFLKEDQWLSGILRYDVWEIVEKKNKQKKEFDSSQKSFLYAKIPVTKISSISKLSELGFIPIETLVNFRGDLLNDPEIINLNQIRFAKEKDLSDVANIALNNFSHSRFHNDPNILNSIANKIKKEWITNFFYKKRGDELVVVEINKKVRGFLLLFWNKTNELTIDLLCVDKKFQNKGLARKMIKFASKNFSFKKKNPLIFKVGTQINNFSSIKLYQRLGLKLNALKICLHLHRNKKIK